MQALTLTGATLLNNNNVPTSPSPSPKHQEPQQGHKHDKNCSHNQHQHGPNCKHDHSSSNVVQPTTTTTPTIQAIDLVQQHSDDDHLLLQTAFGIVRVSNFEYFDSFIQAWRTAKEKQVVVDKGSSATHPTYSVDIILQQYDINGYTLAHWAAKRVDDIRFMQFTLTLPWPVVMIQNWKYHENNNAVQDAPTITSSHQFSTVLHRPSKEATAMTPIHWACTMPDALLMINTMLQHSANNRSGNNRIGTNTSSPSLLEIPDGSGCTPLLIASQHGQVNTVAYLIQKGANVYAIDTSYDTAIHWASYKGSPSVLGLLCYYNTQPLLLQDAYGQTPLHLASLRGHTSAVRYIINHLLHIDPNAEANNNSRNKHGTITDNQNKSLTKNYRTVKEILYLKDKNGRTPYDLAIHKERHNVATVLKAMQDEANEATLIMKKNNQSYIIRFYKWLTMIGITLRSLLSIQSWKLWLFGINGSNMDEYDESPKFPMYYVCFNILCHFLWHYTVFVPYIGFNSNRNADGVLWDYIPLHLTNTVVMILTTLLLYLTTNTNPGQLVLSNSNSNNSGSSSSTTSSSSSGSSSSFCSSNINNANNNNSLHQQIQYWRRLYEETLEQLANEPSSSTKPKYTLCHTCHIARPFRSKHDKITRSCILMFDHHCPFVNNTIGLHNYKYFFMFLFMMSMVFINYWILFVLYLIRQPHPYDYTVMIIGIFLGLHGIFPITMLFMHNQLIYANLTTNEHINIHKYDYLWKTRPGTTHRYYHNPWDRGFIKNFMDRMFPNDMCYMINEEQNHDETQSLLLQSSTENHIELGKDMSSNKEEPIVQHNTFDNVV